MSYKLQFKNYLYSVVVLLAISIAMASCTDNATKAQTKDTAEHANSETFNGFNNKDPQFLINAIEISQEEIYLGELAQQTSHAKDVKDLAAKMQESHMKLQSDIKAIALAKNNTLQTSMSDSTKDNHQRLKQLSAADFDKAYCLATTTAHVDAIALYEKGYKESTDIEMRQFINSGLVVLRLNLATVVAYQNRLNGNTNRLK